VTFIVDGMLGKLAKWLKILGFDALFMADDDDKILAVARGEGRVLLTRDREFVRRAGRHPSLLVESTLWPDQVRQVLARFYLYGSARPFTRCLECNVPLETLSRDAAARLVSPHVLERADAFSLCPACGRVYWPGTHQSEMERTIRDLLQPFRNAGTD
jgi:uncharacterized protein